MVDVTLNAQVDGYQPERLLKFFNYEPGDRLGQVYAELALGLIVMCPAGPERTLALRSLIASMDDARRSLP